jgi:hypothetical protein
MLGLKAAASEFAGACQCIHGYRTFAVVLTGMAVLGL